MSLHSSADLSPKLSYWHASKDNTKYSYRKSDSDSKIQSIKIYVLSGENNQRLEVHAQTHNLETYLKILEVAQNYFSDKSKYYFNSTYDNFPKDCDGFCTLEAVKERQSQFKNGLFERTHLEATLAYHSLYETKEELSQQLSHALNILQAVDNSVEEITGHVQSLLKV